MKNLSGKKAIITGASRGIGVAIATRFAAEGADVVLTARTVDEHDHLEGSLNETEKIIKTFGQRSKVIVADLMDASDRQRILQDGIEFLGGLDILVNNAAANFFIPFEKYSDKRFRVMFEINVTAPFELARGAVNYMLEHGGGWVLNISSDVATHPEAPYSEHHRSSGCVPYGMSKAALDRMSTGMAAEYENKGIAVNSLAPNGAVATPGTVALGMVPDDPEMVESVEQMAEAALALCTKNPTELTGRVAYSGTLLKELGLPVRNLDGVDVYSGPYAR